MRTLQLGAEGLDEVTIEIDAGELQIFGTSDVHEVIAHYGYFLNNTEVLDEDAMVPDFRIEVSPSARRVILRQRPDQIARARKTGAKMILEITVPSNLPIKGHLEHGNIKSRNTGDCIFAMTSGNLHVQECSGLVNLKVNAGTVIVSGIVKKHKHSLSVQSGTLTLFAGSLLGLISATVDQGVIQGEIIGRLERIGPAGWRLYAASHEPGSSIECKVGSGTIMLFKKMEEMSAQEVKGYRKVRASELPHEEQVKLRNALQHDLAAALIKEVKSNPPDIDLAKVELVLRPNQQINDWNVAADCGTCKTCGTGGICVTCGISRLADDIPIGVVRELGIEPKIVVDVKNLKESMSRIATRLEKEK